MSEVRVSSEFKKTATKSVLAIVLFAVVYLLLVAFAIGLTIACGYAGIAIITEGGHIILIILGAAIICLGFLVLFFLIKFIFASNKQDDTGLEQIYEDEHPQLFTAIREIVEEVGTHFPKKVYLSHEVNAYVFYNSNFWSMFLPVKKNLCIGMGLVNSTSVTELKSILAHEFGHFSQKSMKVGSFVYNVNKVIHNMLYQNNSYANAVSTFSSIHGIFALVASIAVGIVRAMQWIMQQMYAVINKSYMSLSRQMEFHADAVAASVTGSVPLANALLRLDLAETAYSETINFYNNKIDNNVKAGNFFKNQSFVLNQLAHENNLPVVHDLPLINLENLKRFNGSKIVIKDQWASHPSMADRVVALEALSIPAKFVNNESAWKLFGDSLKLQEEFTGKLFENVQYRTVPSALGEQEFENEYQQYLSEGNFHTIFKNFYTSKEIVFYEPKDIFGVTPPEDVEALLNEKLIANNVERNNLIIDLSTLEQLKQPDVKIKTFDYDGQKYTVKSVDWLIDSLRAKKTELEQQVETNDKKIYCFFRNKALQKNKLEALNELESSYKKAIVEFENITELRNRLIDKTQFITQVLPIHQIQRNIEDFKPEEYQLIEKIKTILRTPVYESILTPAVKENFEKVTTIQLIYFLDDSYIEEELKILYEAMDNCFFVIAKNKLNVKKQVLDFWATLL